MNINRLTLQQLRRHPYINFYMAKAITDYRRLHGDIKSLNELRLSKDFTDEVIQRLEPYIEY
jgi:DNA uptake protein ComE-like DNA-binding protein